MNSFFTFSLTDLCQVLISVCGLVLVVLGWIIPYRQNIEAQKKQREFEQQLEIRSWEKEYVDRQIRELYGPIQQLLCEQLLIFTFVQQELHREVIFGPGYEKFSTWPKNDQVIWIHYVKNYVLPYQEKIVNILRNNQDLIEDHTCPDSYKNFMKYSLAWEFLQNQKNNGVPNFYEYRSISGYPRDFNNYISSTLDKLFKKQKELELLLEKEQ